MNRPSPLYFGFSGLPFKILLRSPGLFFRTNLGSFGKPGGDSRTLNRILLSKKPYSRTLNSRSSLDFGLPKRILGSRGALLEPLGRLGTPNGTPGRPKDTPKSHPRAVSFLIFAKAKKDTTCETHFWGPEGHPWSPWDAKWLFSTPLKTA